MRCSAAADVFVLALAGLCGCTPAPVVTTTTLVSADTVADLNADTEPDAAAADGEPDAAPEVPAKPGPGEWQPDGTAQLYGQWASLTDGTIRALKFSQLDTSTQDLIGVTPVYWLYKYPIGQPPVPIQRGRYKMAPGPTLVLEPVWEADNPRTPPPVAFAILVSKKGQLALDTPAGVRVYDTVDALP